MKTNKKIKECLKENKWRIDDLLKSSIENKRIEKSIGLQKYLINNYVDIDTIRNDEDSFEIVFKEFVNDKDNFKKEDHIHIVIGSDGEIFVMGGFHYEKRLDESFKTHINKDEAELIINQCLIPSLEDLLCVPSMKVTFGLFAFIFILICVSLYLFK